MDSGIVNTIASAMTQSSLPTMPNVYREDGTTERAVKTQLHGYNTGLNTAFSDNELVIKTLGD